MSPSPFPWISVARLWDDAAHIARRRREGVHLQLVRTPIRLYLTKRGRDGWTELASREYQPSGVPGRRNLLALDLFEKSRSSLRKPLLLLNAPYFPAQELLSGVRARRCAIAASVPPRLACKMMNVQDWSFLHSTTWRKCDTAVGALLRPITLGALDGSLYVFDSEMIQLPRRGTHFIAYFGETVDVSLLARAVLCPQRLVRESPTPEWSGSKRRMSTVEIPVQRPNMAVAVRQDARLPSCACGSEVAQPRTERAIRFADMFAGAGGLSLGFLSAQHSVYELCAALDVSRICTTTLKRNFASLEQENGLTGRVSRGAVRLVDLGERKTLEVLLPELQSGQGVDVIVGGPPCQPFSSARRRPAIQSEARLLHCFCEALERLQPSILLLENVQGILWKDASGIAPAQRFIERLSTIGYRVAARVLDAAWYGAAQHRSRAFIVGLHSRVSKSIEPEDAFPPPQWTGSQTRPYKTVADAIGDLPEISKWT